MADINSIESRAEDSNTVKKCLAGDTSSFRILEKKYKKLIASLIRRMIKDEEDVLDLAQETFIKAYNALETFQDGYSFSSWIYRIASNNCIDFLRKKRFLTVSLDQPLFDDKDDTYFDVEDKTSRPDINYLAEERKKIIDDAIDELPENYKEIIKLRHEDDMDYSEIASELDMPIGTVKAHLFRARKLLLMNLKSKKHLFVDL
jgi:RNA polymerase sigma-70 factor (ECF subfamily)